jgi:hypothetical protein
MLCDYCHAREAVVHQFRNHDGFASVCEPCMRATIPPKCPCESAADFCCVTDANFHHFSQTKTAGIGANDTRPETETTND